MKGILTGLCAAAAVLEASADWRDEMWWHSIEPREGVTVRAYALEEPRVMKAYVARIDMTTPGIGFTATERSARWGERIPESTNAVLFAETKRETTCDFMERRRAEGKNVEVAFNTTPWKPWPMPKGCEYCDPVGWCVADGVEVSLHAEERSEALFLVYRDGHCAITSVVSPDDAEKVAFAANGFDNPISHVKGVISMARAADPDSASSQFFITVADSPFLDGQYAAFGYVTDGMDVADQIAKDAQPTDDNGTIPPGDQPVIESIVIEE